MQFILEYGVFIVLGLLAVGELLVPGREFPKLRRWRIKGVAYFVAYLVVATLVPGVVDDAFGRYQLFDLSGLGLGAGTLVGVLALELVSYGWHRALHRVPFLWRWFHQMHHSAERLDVFSAFIFHPFDVVGFTVMGSVALVLLVGLDPAAAGLANLIVFAAVVLGHANLRTPRWLGYIVQRPENHAVHHQRGLHAYNYADFSVIDMLFGTFKNPDAWQGQAGFYDGASERVLDMLRGRDISSAVPESAAAAVDEADEPGAREAPSRPWRELQPGS